jgi:hypothetical protein
MGQKTINIDALLAKEALVLVINEIKYTVADVKMDAYLEATSIVELDPEDEENMGLAIHRQLAIFLAVPVEDLKLIGIKAAALALEAIREWMVPVQEDEAKDSVDP